MIEFASVVNKVYGLLTDAVLWQNEICGWGAAHAGCDPSIPISAPRTMPEPRPTLKIIRLMRKR
jgi:hypothetical protein